MENDKAEIDQVASAHSKKASFFRRLTPIIAAVAVLALVVCVQSWFIYKLKKDVSGLQWSNAIAQHADDSEITTDVGTIQFMKKGGYSITLSAAKYTADGLSLQGEIGNPTAMTITNLALKFTVTKPLYQYVDEYDKDPFWFFVIPPIGEAQAAPIAYIGPGKTSHFEVTIPNVKQTKDGIRMVVSFSGERYGY